MVSSATNRTLEVKEKNDNFRHISFGIPVGCWAHATQIVENDLSVLFTALIQNDDDFSAADSIHSTNDVITSVKFAIRVLLVSTNFTSEFLCVFHSLSISFLSSYSLPIAYRCFCGSHRMNDAVCSLSFLLLILHCVVHSSLVIASEFNKHFCNFINHPTRSLIAYLIAPVPSEQIDVKVARLIIFICGLGRRDILKRDWKTEKISREPEPMSCFVVRSFVRKLLHTWLFQV